MIFDTKSQILLQKREKKIALSSDDNDSNAANTADSIKSSRYVHKFTHFMPMNKENITQTLQFRVKNTKAIFNLLS